MGDYKTDGHDQPSIVLSPYFVLTTKISVKDGLLTVFQIMPILPPEADKNLCGWTDIGPSPPCRTGNFGARQQTHISGTIWPTEIVHLSKFAEFHKELCWTVFKRSLQNFLRH